MLQFGKIVLTTSSGIMDHDEARRKKVGGKVCHLRQETLKLSDATAVHLFVVGAAQSLCAVCLRLCASLVFKPLSWPSLRRSTVAPGHGILLLKLCSCHRLAINCQEHQQQCEDTVTGTACAMLHGFTSSCQPCKAASACNIASRSQQSWDHHP